ncbi:MFS general substrate transporter [Mycena floridula]|nr:MFS general substrate transporter [Mycena floridula]
MDNQHSPTTPKLSNEASAIPGFPVSSEKATAEVHLREAAETLRTYDRAAEYLAKYEIEHGEIPALTAKEEKTMVRRFDLLLVPLITICTILSGLDKANVAQAAIYGMLQDAHLTTDEGVPGISSSVYIGSVIGGLPQIYLMKRFTTHKFIATNLFIWGALTLRSEQPARTAVCFNTFATVANGLVGYASSFASVNSSIAPWRIIFLSCGTFTCSYALVLWFFLPSTVMDAVWMKSPLKRAQALIRIKDEKIGTENHWDQVREVFLDPKTYISCLISCLSNIPGGGLVGFNGIVIIISFIGAFGKSWIAGKTTRYRSVIGAISAIPPMIGVIVFKVLPLTNTKGRLAGVYVMYIYWSPYILGQAIMMNNTAGLTKKTTMYALNYMAFSFGFFIGPQIFLTREAPGYTTAITTMLACYAIVVVLFLVYGRYCHHLNAQKQKNLAQLDYPIHLARLDSAKHQDPSAQQSDSKWRNVEVTDRIVHDDGLMDLTDLQNPHFVYIT